MDNQIEKLILKKLEAIEAEVKEVRQTDIPNLKVDMAVAKTEIGQTAKLITLVGGAVTLAVSTAVAYFK